MAVDNDTKLTKFKSATTIVTADYANSIFGGLYGSSEADNLAPDDPRVIGHVHDGINADGHVGKIDLVDHVDNQLLNINLADDAVTKRNVRETLYPSEAIPEYEIIGGSTYYYLDLGSVRADFPLIEDPVSPSGTPGIIRQRSEYYDGSPIVGVWGTATGRDFVFGSPTLDDTGTTDGRIRFLFDKSLGAFRAGGATGAQWDEVNRGTGSAAFGLNNTAAADYSFSSGLGNTIDSSSTGSVSLGDGNSIVGSTGSMTGPAISSTISNADFSSIISGTGNSITESSYSIIEAGRNSIIEASIEYDASEIPSYSSAFGKRAHSYAFGQRSQSSGTFDPDEPPFDTFSVNPIIPPGSGWAIYMPAQGGAQTFTLTMFGNFEYDFPQLVNPPPLGSPPSTINTAQRFVANLDNAYNSSPASPRVFRPRRNATYSIKTIGCLSFSEFIGGLLRETVRHSVTFEAHTGITVQTDGRIMYDTDSFLITFNSRELLGPGSCQVNFPQKSLPLTGRAAKDDFRIWFTHDTSLPLSAITPTNKTSGAILSPVPTPGFGMSFLVENRTFLNNASPNSTESNVVLVGEALSVRMDVTELNINLYGKRI
jgi:hypothetical protein